MKNRLKWLPNFITSLRIMGTMLLLLFITPVTVPFYIVYTLSGITDCLDGFVARRLKLTSELGAKLDSIADLLYYAVMIIQVFPILFARLPKWIWIWVIGIGILRVLSYGTAYLNERSFASLHTILNKATGLFTFFVPYLLKTEILSGYCMIVCTLATISAIQELSIHIGKRCNAS